MTHVRAPHTRAAVCMLSALLLLAGCGGRDHVQRFTGIIEANTVRVSAQTAGRVTQRLFEEGDTVSPGRLLATVETDRLGYQLAQNDAQIEELSRQQEAARLQMKAARIQRDNLKTRLDRFTTLLADEAVTVQAVDDLRAQYEAADAQLRAAEASLSSLTSRSAQVRAVKGGVNVQVRDADIRAPLQGVVLVRYADAGELLGVGSPVCDVADLRAVWTRIYIPEPLLARVRLGQRMRVVPDGLEGAALTGTVTWIGDRAEFTPKAILTEETRASLVYPAKVSITNDRGILKIGMPVTVEMDAAQ
jgi:HlyD family secretion protein